MKKHMLFVVTLGLSLGLATTSANAQAGGIRANVPFNFTVFGTTLPAGQYTMIAGPHQVSIQDAHGKMVVRALSNEISDGSAGATGKIIFHCYSEHCFLSEVWTPTQENGRQLFTSRAETEWAKAERGKYFAVLGDRPGK